MWKGQAGTGIRSITHRQFGAGKLGLGEPKVIQSLSCRSSICVIRLSLEK